MTNLLVLPELGQGPDTWGSVWGHLTAPRQHPPSLSLAAPVDKVTTIDFYGPDFNRTLGSDRKVRLSDAIDYVAEKGHQLGAGPKVAVAHGLSASILLASLPKWDPLPERVVLFAGAAPRQRGAVRSPLPKSTLYPLRLLSTLHRLIGRRLTIPQHLIYRKMCNGMETMEVVHYVASFRPLPLHWLGSRLTIPQSVAAQGLTYVVLERDRLLPPSLQRQQARHLGAREIASLDACHQAMLQKPAEVAEIIRRVALTS